MSAPDTQSRIRHPGQFKPGQSGNPSGRPATASNALRKRAAEVAPEIIELLLEAARGGDVAASRALLDKVLPNIKPTAAPVSVELAPESGLAGTAWSLVSAAAAGAIPPDVAAQLVQAVGTLARVVEVADLEDRLKALEAAHGQS